jgi:hypothetical protein
MRDAACSCGQLSLVAEGEPVRISVCHCLACQRRTGGPFGLQARFPRDRVRISGSAREYVRTSDAGERRTFHFCPDCGATVYYVLENASDTVAVPVGAFADPGFPAPRVSVWESRRHAGDAARRRAARPGLTLLGAYGRILGMPGAKQLLLGATATWIGVTMTPVAFLLFAREATGSYASAGLVPEP